MHIRTELWRERPGRIVVAGGIEWSLSPFVRDGLRRLPVELLEQALQNPVSEAVANADVLITGATNITEAVASQLTNVRFVLRPYVGYDDIDVDALTQQGILFANVPDAFIEEVANHTLALILATNRKLLPSDTFVKQTRWSEGANNRQESVPIRRLSRLTLGLVGFGNIGRLVAERARAFGFRMLAADPYVDPEVIRGFGVEPVALDELLPRADVVSLHVLLNRETRHLIDAQRLALMKPDAVLINTSRGPVVDEAALVAALRDGRLAGAGLDVFEKEPVPAHSPLLGMPNVVLTSHIASYSIEGDIAHDQRTLGILARVIDGGLPERKVVVNKDLYDQLAAAIASMPSGDQSPAPR